MHGRYMYHANLNQYFQGKNPALCLLLWVRRDVGGQAELYHMSSGRCSFRELTAHIWQCLVAMAQGICWRTSCGVALPVPSDTEDCLSSPKPRST